MGTLLPWLLSLTLFSLGCTRFYRCETVWNADGSVDRAIYQEAAATPEPTRRPQLWKQVTFAPSPDKLERDGWTGGITKLPVRPDGSNSYFAAWGRFKSPQHLPDHVLFDSPKDVALPPGKLVRDCQYKDYGLIQEYHWRETLTDVVQLDDIRQAREELADLLIDLWQDSFKRTFGQEYDATDLVKLMQTEGKTWLRQMTDFAFVHCMTRKGSAAQKELWDGLARICTEHELLLGGPGQRPKNEEYEKIIEEFVVDKLCHYVQRKKDNKRLDKETAIALWGDLRGKKQGWPFGQAIENVIDAKHGGKEAFDQRFGELLLRVFGHYFFRFIFPESFDYSLTVPGEIVGTNGQILAVDRARWQFRAEEAYPAGYVMECRSLLLRSEIQKQLFPKSRLSDRDARLQFILLVRDDEQLVKVLQDCVSKQSVMPLYTYRSQAADPPTMDRLFRLLKLPQKPHSRSR
jgi:hypothetical protein